MDAEKLRGIFYGECADYLASADEQFQILRDGGGADAALNALFRAVHSIKGGARAFGLDALAEFAHHFETFMDRLRKGAIPLDEANFDRLTLGFDALPGLIGEARGDGGATIDTVALIRDLRVVNGDADGGSDSPSPWFKPVPVGLSGAGSLRRFILSLTPAPHMFAAGTDPLFIIRDLAELGAVEAAVDVSRVPPLDEFRIDTPYLTWSLRIETGADANRVREILDYVDDTIFFELEEEEETGAEPGTDASPSAPLAVSAVERRRDAVAPIAATTTVSMTAVAADPPTPRDERRVRTVRVDAAKLERLGNMVGELVIAQAVLQRQAVDIPEEERPGLFRAIKDMSQYIRDLQDIATAVRAQPLRAAFARLVPIARDLERATGKRFRLTMRGEDTEIDKTVVDRLAEPLTHLLRNSVDHGLEAREDRMVAGKPAEGTVILAARQAGGLVHVSIEDDGSGINRNAVRAKAVERGLIPFDADLSAGEIDNLIFAPGFSTAERVTEVSGRGVGMDVVRQTINELGGQIVVESEPGAGTRFTLVLPLSLAIVDVLVAEVGARRYLLPIGAVIESLRPLPSQIVDLPGRGRFLHLRGAMLPIIRLADEFAVENAANDPTRAILIIVELRRGARGALLVDSVLSQEPVVVKSLERNYRKVPGIAAATILGDGRAALIVDPPGLRGAAAVSPRAQTEGARR